jgi:sugar phosphate isomerase/epimerase
MTRNPTRREVLEVTASAAASMLVGPASRVAAQARTAWKAVPIGTQAWCVRKQLATEIPGTLAALAKLGYQAVELENAFGKSGKEWQAYLGGAGLKACGFHHRFDELQGDKLQAAVEFNQAIGNRNLIIRSLSKEVYTDADLLKKTSETVNQIAERLKPHNLRVGYHNHTTDFNRLGGEYWWNLFADQTTKDVILQFDTGNASEREGVNVIELIRRNPGRTASMHVKPFSKKNPDAYLGDDELNWKEIMTAAESIGGIEWYIIEYEREAVPPLESLGANLKKFKAMRA